MQGARSATRPGAARSRRRGHGAVWPLQRPPRRQKCPANSTRSNNGDDGVRQTPTMSPSTQRAVREYDRNGETPTPAQRVPARRWPGILLHARLLERRALRPYGPKEDASKAQPIPNQNRRRGAARPRCFCSWASDGSPARGRVRRSLARGAVRERGPASSDAPARRLHSPAAKRPGVAV